MRALCLPHDKVRSFCTAPQNIFFFFLSFFFEGVVQRGTASPGSTTVPEVHQHRATSRTQTVMHMYLFSAVYGVAEPRSCFSQWRGTGVPSSRLGTPRTRPGHPKRRWALISPPSHLKQAPNLGRRFVWHFVGRRSCRLRETCHEAGLLCRIKSK